jgi:hypothetical protein
MIKPILAFIFLIVSFHCYSQNTFIKGIGITEMSPGVKQAIELNDGSIVCMGPIQDFVAEGYYVLKLTPSFNPIWIKNFGEWASWGQDEPVNIFETPDSGIMIICRSYHSDISGDYSDGLLLLKYNSNGDTIFQKRYMGNFWGPFHMYQYADGSLLCVVNSIEAPVNDSSSMHIIKLDMNANITWTKSFKTTFNAKTYFIKPFQNSFFLYGSTDYPDTNQGYLKNVFLQKLDSSGNVIWAKTYSIPNFNLTPFKMFVLNDGRILTINNKILMSFDSTGIPIVTKRADNFIIRDCILSTDSTVEILGRIQDTTTFIGNFILKTNLVFDTIALTQLPNVNNFSLESISHTLDNGYLVSAMAFQDSSFYLIKSDSFNFSNCTSVVPYTLLWSSDSVFYDTMFLSQDTLQNYYYFNNWYSDLNCTISFVNELCNFTSVDDEKKQNVTFYPNPFSTDAAIHATTPIDDSQIRIYNGLGVLVREEKISKLNSYKLHRNSLRDGLYFYELRSPNSELIGTGKFVIQ